MRKGLWIVVVGTLAAAATAQAAEIAKTTPAGKEVLVRNHTELTSGCAGSIPSIDIAQKPAHGALDIRAAHFVLPPGAGYTGVKTCEGREVDGGGLWYTPAVGFHGVDTFAWSVKHGKGRRIEVDEFTAKVTVQ